MFSINATLSKIIFPKKTRNDYYVIPVILSFSYGEKPQTRYMQCVSQQAKDDLKVLSEGDRVIVRIALKGVTKNDKCFNLDEIIGIEKA